ncbi:DUF2130 domain-containing protein [Streptococcus sp. DD12]|uniref:DUF2130 domain-containing protein n=1 Tax=Streptococcus sp. DD12 TaxID=1777880 RepID=UPI00079C1A6D|nr:DUF2130 domain-containing protein [Streptococcus sp. DD12]KXT76391.1 hypothetical protein STRDD12_00570 [Streptococcus sp. DD12]
MSQITCPHCGTVFTVDQKEYSQLLSQVRSSEFEKEVHDRLEKEKELLKERAKNDLKEQAQAKDKKIDQLSHEIERQKQAQEMETQALLTQKEQAISELTSQLEKAEAIRELEVRQALASKETELTQVKNQLEVLSLENKTSLVEAVAQVEKERDAVKNQLDLQEKEAQLSLSNLQQEYELKLKAAQQEVDFYKNFKAQQSTKAIGESLEIYAETEFNKVRAYAFPNASFEKDNTISGRGSKGDFIYRETDENGVEILSIMFEMKNESDETKTKHKNRDFYKELDKDRTEKNCEYAVLVTMLEADNDYFNTGIVDVSHEFPKMYVVRPQLFIQLIGLLRNAALNSLKYKQELAQVREQHVDITHFEDDLESFKKAFAKNYNSASSNFKKAIDEIDKSIKRMEAVKAALTTSENQLRLANNKLDDVSVKKLTRKNPTMREKFAALKSD